MKTLSELEADLAKLQAEIEEIKNPKGRYVPKNFDRVFCVTSIEPEPYFYDDDNPHSKQLADLGLLVPTIEEYHRVVAKMKAREKLLRCEGAREGVRIGEDNYFIRRTDNNNYDLFWSNNIYGAYQAYFDTKEQAKAALDSMTKEELDALFPVVGV